MPRCFDKNRADLLPQNSKISWHPSAFKLHTIHLHNLISIWFKQHWLTHGSEKHQQRVFVPCGSQLCFQTLNEHFNITLISRHSPELWACQTRNANMHCSRSFLLFCKTQSQSHVQGATVISYVKLKIMHSFILISYKCISNKCQLSQIY